MAAKLQETLEARVAVLRRAEETLAALEGPAGGDENKRNELVQQMRSTLSDVVRYCDMLESVVVRRLLESAREG